MFTKDETKSHICATRHEDVVGHATCVQGLRHAEIPTN